MAGLHCRHQFLEGVLIASLTEDYTSVGMTAEKLISDNPVTICSARFTSTGLRKSEKCSQCKKLKYQVFKNIVLKKLLFKRSDQSLLHAGKANCSQEKQYKPELNRLQEAFRTQFKLTLFS